MLLDRAGLPKGRGVYHNLATFGQAGTWDGEAKLQRHHLEVLDDASGHRGRARRRASRAPGGVTHEGRRPSA